MVTKYIGDKLEMSGTESGLFHQHLKKFINVNFAFYFMHGSVAKVGCVFSNFEQMTIGKTHPTLCY